MISLWQRLLLLPLSARLSLFIAVFSVWTGLCLWPVYEPSGDGLINDKVAHFVGNFGVLGVLIIWRQQLPLLLACGLVFVYSFVIECLQLSIPGRFFDYYDLVANACGAIVAMIVVSTLRIRTGVERGFI